jgi:hypothetical protein
MIASGGNAAQSSQVVEGHGAGCADEADIESHLAEGGWQLLSAS